jgi:ParB family transcriptional regulator, chromosome partitioning protein
MNNEDGSLSYLPVASISVRGGHNPRRYFDATEMAQLEESVRQVGILQPIVVRPLADGRFEVVAGERRLRAAKAAGIEEVPTVIRVFDEETAHQAAVVENSARSDMSESDEAQGARRVVDRCGGDRDAAAKTLGWSRRKLDSRLLLLHADESVLTALTERKIKLGAAELLSSLPAAIQQEVLTKYLASGASVEELRAKLDAFSFRIEKAVFDKAGCRGCPHNTSDQADLFTAHIGKARCTNPVCWKDKEAAQIAALKAEKEAEIGLVKLDTEADPATYTILLKKDVGEAQLMACRGCAHYGAVMATAAGRLGNIQSDVCFNLVCHKTKREAHSAALAAETDTRAAQSEQAPGAAAGASATKGAAPKAAKPAAKASAADSPRKVIEYAERLHARAAAAEVSKQPKLGKAFAVAAMLGEYLHENAGFGEQDPTSAPVKALLARHYPAKPKLSATTRREDMVVALMGVSDEALDALLGGLAAGIAGLNRGAGYTGRINYRAVQLALHKTHGTELGGYFKVERGFLETLTKGGMEAVLREAGYATWLDKEKGSASFAKLMGKKREEIIAAVLASGFDFTGFVPSVMRYDRKAG